VHRCEKFVAAEVLTPHPPERSQRARSPTQTTSRSPASGAIAKDKAIQKMKSSLSQRFEDSRRSSALQKPPPPKTIVSEPSAPQPNRFVADSESADHRSHPLHRQRQSAWTDHRQ
jgi:hypothetical protein